MDKELNPHEMPRPDELALLPVRNTVLFPYMTLPLSIGREKSLQVLKEANNGDKLIGIVAQIDGNVDEPGDRDLYRFGTLGRIIKSSEPADGMATILVQGVERFRIEEKLTEDPYLKVRVQYFPEKMAENDEEMELQAKYRNLKNVVTQYIRQSPNIPDEAVYLIERVPTASYLADMVGHYMDMEVKEKQSILEKIDIDQRMEYVTELLTRELDMLELSNKIQNRVKEKIDRHQREVYLREQMKAIQKELGDEGGESEEIEKLRTALEEKKMPEEAHNAAMKELGRMERMHTSSPEYSVIRTYLDWMLDIPWNDSTEDKQDIAEAEKILNEDHYDLEKVKRRILEFLAVRKLKPDMRGPILCLQGPPGVGKTSLGKSVARSLGREFVRLSLGGVRDEAEIRGHRRTYIGSMPGRIVKSLKKAATNNPVFMLDEIDKLGADFRGDPSSALLEVLDPEQNFAFSDHYIDVPIDLSKVLFIATSNTIDTVPPALRDRLEVINIPGYTEHEKLMIAKKYLVPENIEEHGLSDELIEFSDESLLKIINSYTREAGVRNLKREIAGICRRVAKDVAYGKKEKTLVDASLVVEILGAERFYNEVAQRTARAGVATGMAWTPVGGDILFIEATKMKGKGGLTLTGQLGDVMKESARAALSYVHAQAELLGIGEDLFEKEDVHVHVPSGAIPKDGPSAGVTMMTALTSLFLNKPIASDMAMTGEITLRGAVLPVGGIKEKVLAAKRAGLKRILLPKRNEKDLEDISEDHRKGLDFVFVEDMSEVLNVALDLNLH